MELEIDEIINTSSKPIILDYALLPWLKQFESIDVKILLTTSFEERFSRVNSRENITKEYFEKRDSSIKNYDDFSFDFIIDSTNEINVDKILSHINLIGGKND